MENMIDKFCNDSLEKNKAFLLDKSNSPFLKYKVLKDLFGVGEDASELKELKKSIDTVPEIIEYYKEQNQDGSWGNPSNLMSRIMATIWGVHSLTELGFSKENEMLVRAKDFLVENSFIKGGVSINGKDDGVLSCYTGIICRALSRAGFLDEAQLNVSWIIKHQEFIYKNTDYLGEKTSVWNDSIRSKYGGCMKETSCFIGVARIACALKEYAAHEESSAVKKRILASRSYFLDRELFKRDDKINVIPLGASKNEKDKKSKEWLKISYPLAYIPDLVDIFDFVNHTGEYHKSMDSAFNHLKSLQLADGTWPLQKSAKQKFLYTPEKSSMKKPSAWATYRVLKALKS